MDRNQGVHYDNYNLHWSLSARRAWIEIIDDFEPSSTRKSLSARRAWIEIDIDDKFGGLMSVALRKESVDRNLYAVQIVVVIV